MKFDNAVEAVWRMTELRRIAGAHVVDHRRLTAEELKAAIIKAKPQYLDEETVRANLEFVLYQEPQTNVRVLSRLILIDVLLDQFDFEFPVTQTEERVIAFEQSVVNRSNEIDLVDLACTNQDSSEWVCVEAQDFHISVTRVLLPSELDLRVCKGLRRPPECYRGAGNWPLKPEAPSRLCHPELCPRRSASPRVECRKMTACRPRGPTSCAA